MPEQESNRAFAAEIAAVLGKGMAHVGHRAHAIVRHAIHDDRSPADTVTLVADFLIADALEFAAAAFGGALDGVLRHVVRIGLVHGQAQPRVAARVGATQPRRDRDFLDEPGKDLAALGVLASLAVLDVRPFAVTCHTFLCVDSAPLMMIASTNLGG